MAKPDPARMLGDDPLWYKDAIIYELHVRTFYDADGDGVGDFRGLTEKLDYLQDLGVTALWLLPFYPSPWSDDGYDIADYTDVHPAYGTLADFKRFLRQAHARGLRVITEMVINHTSDQHPWFRRARSAKRTSRYRDYYVWSDSPDRYPEARVIFQDFESSNWAWDAVAEQYYWHRFYSQQPDLNFDNPQVHKAVLRAMDFWFRLGVDGMRLDAVPYLYEREGTNCENLPETHAFLKKVRRYVDERHPSPMLLAEANQWPEDSAAYFGEGDECHMAFHFPVMPRLFMAIRLEDRFPIIEIMKQTPPIPETCQWATFLRNHDELTLEMVTDEERDYMYRVYAHDQEAKLNLGIRRRLAPLLGNDRRKIELMNGLLFSLPGTPVLYYGDEIGMGDNFFLGDRNGVRTPMQWSGDRNAGFSTANPQRLYLPVIIDPEYHYETVNVETQQANPSSLLWWTRRLISMRKRHKALSRGTLEFLYPDNPKVLAFVRRYGGERILAIFNLSRFVQCVELDLSEFEGLVPVELSGQTMFPPIGELPYFLTLGPHAFYWFLLHERAAAEVPIEPAAAGPAPEPLDVAGHWSEVFGGRTRESLEAHIRRYLRAQRWFGGKAKRIRAVAIVDVVPLPAEGSDTRITFVRVVYIDSEPETYLVPIAAVWAEEARSFERDRGQAVIASVRAGDREGLLCDALARRSFAASLLDAMRRRRRSRGDGGRLRASSTAELRELGLAESDALQPSWVRAQQSNTSIAFDDLVMLKVFRRIEPGVNPDFEIGRVLERHGFTHTPPIVGHIDYQRGPARRRRESMTLALLHRYVPNEGDAWRLTCDALSRYVESVLARGEPAPDLASDTSALLELAERPAPPEPADELFGGYLPSAKRLGELTGEMHRTLAAETADPAFAPEPFTRLYQRSVYQSMRNLTSQVLQGLERTLGGVPEAVRPAAETLVAASDDLLRRFRAILDGRMEALRIRTHGDYHLGQVLYTGKDFSVIDFEGEPARPIGTRRIKRTPLRDVAGMVRSFHYAAYGTLRDLEHRGLVRPDDGETLEPWARFWYACVAGTYLRAYRAAIEDTALAPDSREELTTLLDVYLLEKAIYEVGYEMNNRPDWLGIPIRAVLELLRS